MYFQLAIHKSGTIAGTYINSSTDATQEVEGAVDQQTQRAAWAVGGQDWPIVETGISSLTMDQAPALMHFADGQTQQWLMVRLEDPEAQ